jgi:hypothetical protein
MAFGRSSSELVTLEQRPGAAGTCAMLADRVMCSAVGRIISAVHRGQLPGGSTSCIAAAHKERRWVSDARLRCPPGDPLTAMRGGGGGALALESAKRVLAAACWSHGHPRRESSGLRDLVPLCLVVSFVSFSSSTMQLGVSQRPRCAQPAVRGPQRSRSRLAASVTLTGAASVTAIATVTATATA